MKKTTRVETEMGGLLRQKQVLELIPISSTSWWRGIQEGIFPKGHRMGPKTTVWKASDIQDLIDRITADDLG